MIRYLAPFEKEQARPLWEQAFPEDDQIFLDYYAKTTLPGNRLLAEEENGQVIGMVHRNPYQVQSGNRIWNSEYIVGVATDRSRRHQGIMRRLLTRALTDAASEGLPFVYLMPASESIYRPFGFAAVHAQPAWKLTEKARRGAAGRRVMSDKLRLFMVLHSSFRFTAPESARRAGGREEQGRPGKTKIPGAQNCAPGTIISYRGTTRIYADAYAHTDSIKPVPAITGAYP